MACLCAGGGLKNVPDLLDIAFPPADPGALAADVRAAGARAVGLYVINLSAPSTVQSAAYAKAAYAAGVQVLPIITPGQSPPPVAGVPDALLAWGQLNTDNAVALDIEQPGIDTPPPGWVQALVNTLDGTGYKSWLYVIGSLRSTYPYGLWWAVDWDHGDQAKIPPGAVAVQYSPTWRGPSGHEYDPSYVDQSALGGLDMATLEELAAQITEMRGVVGEIYNALDWGTPVGGQAPQGWVPVQLKAIEDTVSKLAAVTGADPNALAQAVVAAIKQQWAK